MRHLICNLPGFACLFAVSKVYNLAKAENREKFQPVIAEEQRETVCFVIFWEPCSSIPETSRNRS